MKSTGLTIFYKVYVFLLCNKEVFLEPRKVATLDFRKRLPSSMTPALTERATWSKPGCRL